MDKENIYFPAHSYSNRFSMEGLCHENDIFERLECYLNLYLSFDSIIVLGYQENDKPIFLNGNYSEPKTTNKELLSTSMYTHDPFYYQLAKTGTPGVFFQSDIVKNKKLIANYRNKFRVNWFTQSELAICVQIDSTRWIAICIGRDENNSPFSAYDKSCLESIYEKFAILCRNFWPQIWFFRPGATNNNLANILSVVITTFGHELLTQREQEISTLIILGFDNKAIANNLGISLTTVKTHRRTIYSKLNIASIGDLFQLFLNQLLKQSY